MKSEQRKRGRDIDHGEVSSKLRIRCIMACETCRRYKVKCTAENDGCITCIMKSVDCVYRSRRRKRSKPRKMRRKSNNTTNHNTVTIDNLATDSQRHTDNNTTTSTDVEILNNGVADNRGQRKTNRRGRPSIKSPRSSATIDNSTGINTNDHNTTDHNNHDSSSSSGSPCNIRRNIGGAGKCTETEPINSAALPWILSSEPISTTPVSESPMLPTTILEVSPVERCSCFNRTIVTAAQLRLLKTSLHGRSKEYLMGSFRSILQESIQISNCAICADRIDLYFWLEFIRADLNIISNCLEVICSDQTIVPDFLGGLACMSSDIKLN